MEERLENWVPFPRELASDYRDRKITRDEFFIYSWIRINANAYGKSTTSLSDLSNDVLRKKNKENYVNKILLSLKEKRYIYYPKRTGCRGSFNVTLDDFILPNKKISSIDKYFKTEEFRTLDTNEYTEESEPEKSFDMSSQNWEELNHDIKSMASSFSVNSEVRTYNKDNDINKNNIKSIPINEGTNLSNFKPKSLDERYCLEIAINLGEKNMGSILSSLKKYGREHLEKAWRQFQEEEQKIEIKNRGAYFNSLVKRIYDEYRPL